jgi:anti-sigma B factor antagonist
MVMPTKTKVEQIGDIAVMRFEGDITSTSEEAILGSYKALPTPTTKILLDFSKVPYLNSSGIALVIQLLMAASKAPQKVLCFGLTPHFVKVFTMLGLAKYTTLHADEASARAAAIA